jgi:ribosomal protein L37AE/L43A
MPKLTRNIPEPLRALTFHKVDLDWEGDKEAHGDCPFCGADDKFFASQKTGKWDCKICNKTGNQYTFIRELHAAAVLSTTDEDIAPIAENRRVSVAMLRRWGLARSPIDQEWVMSSYQPGKPDLANLYRWVLIDGKRRLLPTATIDHALFNVQNWDDKKRRADILEGPWDGSAWEEALMKWRQVGTELRRTADPERSLFNEINVVATPGQSVFLETWIERFRGVHTRILYDNDHPSHSKTGQFRPAAGTEGAKRIVRKLSGVAASLQVLYWGPEGYDPDFPSGFDVRDYLAYDVPTSA